MTLFHRQLSQDLVDTLLSSPFWPQIVADKRLHPEIRRDKVTVYYSGCAIMRELKLQQGQLSCSVSLRHVPFAATGSGQVQMTLNPERGLEFDLTPVAIPLGLGTEDVLAAYKMAAQVTPEKKMLGAVLNHRANEGVVVDQEIAFAGGERSDDRIDLCYFDSDLRKLAFVEIKRVDDKRLMSCGGDPPEVLTQLQNYTHRFENERPNILEAFRKTIELKRKLNLDARVCRIPTDEPKELLMRPILAIGGCTEKIVQEILNADTHWKPLLDGLPQVAAGLHLFGNSGFTLGLRPGSQTKVWGTD